MKSAFRAFWLSGFLASALMLAAAPALSTGKDRLQVGEVLRVVDGDTVRLGEERIRIIGLDAPEMRGQCRKERRLAIRARDRLEALLATDDVEILRSARTDKYRRTLAIIRADGVDVARVLIAEGLARPYGGERRRGWCGS